MIYSIFNKLNKIKKFPFFFISPLIYAIGNGSEQVYLRAYYATSRKKCVEKNHDSPDKDCFNIFVFVNKDCESNPKARREPLGSNM